MKKIYLSFALIFLFSLPLLTQAATTDPNSSAAGQSVLNFLGETATNGGLTAEAKTKTDVLVIVAAIINTVLSLVGIIFFVQMFYHGFRWMMSGGTENIIEESKQGIKQSIIGIVIVFSSFIATNFVLNRIQNMNAQASTWSTTVIS